MRRITPKRIDQLKLKLKVAKAERKICQRAANAATKHLNRVNKVVNKLEDKLNEASGTPIMAQP